MLVPPILEDFKNACSPNYGGLLKCLFPQFWGTFKMLVPPILEEFENPCSPNFGG
jgi:hypothetical protein